MARSALGDELHSRHSDAPGMDEARTGVEHFGGLEAGREQQGRPAPLFRNDVESPPSPPSSLVRPRALSASTAGGAVSMEALGSRYPR